MSVSSLKREEILKWHRSKATNFELSRPEMATLHKALSLSHHNPSWSGSFGFRRKA